jgi:glycosyltransferase involved in cell wall biosynthesis
MKALHVAPSRNSESSAAWRILAAQRKIGIDAEALVHKKFHANNTLQINSEFPVNYKNSQMVNSALRRITKSGHGSPWSYNFISPDFSKQLEGLEYDLINLHWLPSTISLKSLGKITKPIVITLHDVWNLTGGCHCNLECELWKIGCGECPQQPKHLPLVLKAESILNLKETAYGAASSLTIVAPSNWIGEMALASPLFKNRQIRVISNAIDPDEFKPLDYFKARAKLKLNPADKVALLVISGDVTAHHKGFDLLERIISEISLLKSEDDRVQYLVVGDSSGINGRIQRKNLNFLGQINSEEEMIQIYSAADVVLSTSRQDNLPNVLLEAMMCGKPVVAFNIGGIPNIVKPGITGELIAPFDCTDFAINTLEIFRKNKSFDSHVIRDAAIRRFSSDTVGQQYLKLYQEIIYESK